MALLAVLLFLIPAFTGALAWLRWDLAREHVTILAGGLFTGLSSFVLVLFGFYFFFPLSPVLIFSLLSLYLCFGLIIIFDASRQQIDLVDRWRHLSFDRWAAAILVITGIIFSIIAPKLLLVNETGGLSTGIINAYGDVAWHASNITYFANNHAFPPENPIFAGHPLVYPFLTNFFSAALLVSGLSLAHSVTVPAVILIPFLFITIYAFGRSLFKHSRFLPILTVLLFLFGGATLGITRFPSDLRESGVGLGEFLMNLPNADYSGVGTSEEGFHFLNPSTSLLLPQRAFMFGLPLALLIIYLFLTTIKTPAYRHFFFAGILSGILPLFHAHTVLALIPAILVFSFPLIRKPAGRAGLLIFVFTTLIVGLPSIWYYHAYMSGGSSFFRWDPGWMSDGNFIWYWFKNTGFVLPLVLTGLFLPAPLNLKKLFLAGLILFIAANLFLFAPWAWDNFKLIIYFFIFSLPLFVWTLVWLSRKLPRPATVAIILIVILTQTSAATLDIWKLLLPSAATWEEWDQDALAAAAMITQNTPPDAVIATAPNHNSAVVLSGRPRYLGYAAHVWSHGGNPWNREKSLSAFYQGRLTKLPETPVQYVLVGPAEINQYKNIVPGKNWQLISQSKNYQLYQLAP